MKPKSKWNPTCPNCGLSLVSYLAWLQGSKVSKRKKITSRRNGRKGGRPRKQPIPF